MKSFSQRIYNYKGVSPCYFRTTAIPPYKKAVIQITERCNLSCAHCFVSANKAGKDMNFLSIKEMVLDRLLKENVKKITLTGGEPLIHPQFLEICRLFSEKGIEITVCTNGTLVNKSILSCLSKIQGLKFNISLDGFSFKSHGRFRGMRNKDDFNELLNNIRKIGAIGKLNGILCTPQVFCEKEEFEKICIFAKENHAKYVLFNPLSKMGRGQNSLDLSSTSKTLEFIRSSTEKYIDKEFEVIYIRFPNDKLSYLPKCNIGNFIYIFTNGEYTFCPYVVFACNNENSPYNPHNFIEGNVFENDLELSEKLQRSLLNKFSTPSSCSTYECFGGCPAAKIMAGNTLDDCDYELCPLQYSPQG